MQVTYTAGKRGPQVLRLKDPLMTPEDALKRRDEIINLNFTKKRNRKNNFYFEQMDEAVKAGNKGRIQFLKDIGSEKAYKAFDGKKVEAIKEVPVEYVTAATAERSRYAREFETALSDQIGKALDDVRSDAWEIRNKHFYS
jgi:predicted metal-dependent peptidase